MAKKKISELPAGSALNGSEIVPIVQTGTTKRVTAQDIANLGNASGVEGSGTINYLSKFTASSTIGNSNLINDASGQLGFGVTPSPWSSSLVRAFQIGNLGGSISSFTALNTSNPWMFMDNNAYNDGTNDKYILSKAAARYVQVLNEHRWLIAPSGTAGGNITFTQAMTLDASGQLGIGTTSPSNKLDVNGSVRFTNGTNPYLALYDGTSTSYLQVSGGNLDVRVGGANAITFNTNSAERMRITAGGNVGIGTTPQWGLSGYVSLEIGNYGTIYSTTSSGSTITIANNLYHNGSNWIYKNTNAASLIGQSSGDVTFETATSGSAGGVVTLSEKMRITNGGNLGLGATSGFGNVSGTETTLHIQNSNVASLYLNSTTGIKWALYASASGRFTFSNLTDSINPLTINPTGNIGVNTSVDAGYKLDVNGTARVSGQLNVSNSSALRLTRYATESTYYGDIAYTSSGLILTSIEGYIKIGKGTGASPTTYLSIIDGGAATFSSSVTSISNTNGQIAISPASNISAAAFTASNAGGGCYFGKNNSTGGAFTGTAYATVVYSGGDVPMAFYTNDTERMRITSSAQLAIGTTTPDASAKVQIDSTTQGFLVPRMTETEINAIGSPAEGLMVYNTDQHHMCMYDGSGWKKFSMSNM